jgi:hypothetical protein
MIIKLPIVIDCKIVNGSKSSAKILFHNFSVERNNDIITLDLINPYNKLEYVKLPCMNNNNCIHYLKVTLPLKFTLFDNKLFSDYFFTIACQSRLDKELDFFHFFIKNYKFKKKIRFFNLNDISVHQKFIFTYIKKFNMSNKYKNVSSFLNDYYIYTNLNLNLGLMINYLYPNYTNKIIKNNINSENIISNKKLLNICNIIKSYEFSYKMSHEYTIKNHLINFSKNQMKSNKLDYDKSYFISRENNKSFKVFVTKSNNNNNILLNGEETDYNKYMYTNYPKFFEKFLNKDDLFIYLTNLNLIDHFIKKFYKDNNYKKLILYFDDNFKCIDEFNFIKNMNIEFLNFEKEFEFLKNNENYLILTSNIESEKIKNLISKHSNDFTEIKKILKILFDNYTFPIEYNKRKLDHIFEKILYISFIFCNDILKHNNDKIYVKPEINEIIPFKLKNLYQNLVRLYYNYINLNSISDLIYNFKLHNDFIHYEVIKTIFESGSILDDLFKLNDNVYVEIINTLKKIGILSVISRRIKWKNISKKLPYLRTLIENKDILFYQDKLNKSILPENFDSRLKKIILNPFEMFKYLKKESDFIKWIYFLNDKLVNLYNVSISISDSDYIPLGKIIYLLTKIDVQDLSNKNYVKFLKYCKKKHRLILYNSRINLRIKELFKFLSVNINLGFLAKHLTFDNSKINIDDVSLNDSEIDVIYKKYYKYKGKYMNLKKVTSSIEYTTSINSNINV